MARAQQDRLRTISLKLRGPGARGPGPVAPRVKRPSLRRTITGTPALPWRSRCTGAFPMLDLLVT